MKTEVELVVKGNLVSNHHDRSVHISPSTPQQYHVHLLTPAPLTCLLASLNMHVLLKGTDTASKLTMELRCN